LRDIVTRLFLRAKQPEYLVRRDPAAVRFVAIIQSIALAPEVAAVKVSAAAECARGRSDFVSKDLILVFQRPQADHSARSRRMRLASGFDVVDGARSRHRGAIE
jgi:hypothetical protein